MEIHQGYENLNIKRPVVTLGIFDGVHTGHRLVIDRVISRAGETDGESVILTFDPHPRQVLSEKEDFHFLTSPGEKAEMLDRYGIDHLVIIHFDAKFSSIDACDFVDEVLVNKTGARHYKVVEGEGVQGV